VPLSEASPSLKPGNVPYESSQCGLREDYHRIEPEST
jgi:hypothetical protein